jgi:hypothetical protein
MIAALYEQQNHDVHIDLKDHLATKAIESLKPTVIIRFQKGSDEKIKNVKIIGENFRIFMKEAHE